jgi:hypothetical protein
MKKLVIFTTILGLAVVLLFSSCERVIDIELPNDGDLLVVEGTIELGEFPKVLVTRNQGFFDNFPSDLQGFVDAFVIKDAIVTVNDGTQTFNLTYTELPFYPFYFYTSTEFSGELGKNYTLTVNADSKSVSAVTSIKPPVPIDSLYFGLNVFDVNEDSLGFIYMDFKDPDTIGNAYRIYAKKRMEPFFFSVEGTTFCDQFINGRNFSIFSGQSDKPFGIQDTFVPQSFFYKLGDTVDIRLASIDYTTYDFFNTLEAAAGGNGNPFSAPTIVKINIKGGLGVWAGLSYTTQTVIAKLP